MFILAQILIVDYIIKKNTMKQFLSLSIMILLLNINLFAQNTVQLRIHQQLGNAPFAFNTGAKNNLNDDFKLLRLEYYLSKFKIVHDGGMETSVSEYALIGAGAMATVHLGTHNITSVEAIKFYIGVDSATNHLDPATYPASHPLSPQLPSMHWGWSSGYRFAALEGYGGSSYDQPIELHGLGDNNYNQAEVQATATVANNQLVMDIYADYTRALENISVNGGTFSHGFSGDARTLLFNLANHVFAGSPTSTIDFSEVNNFSVFPNPTTGKATIALETTEDLTYQVVITDVLGRVVARMDEVKSNQPIETNLEQVGLYFVQLVKDGQTVMTRKLMVE
jgi:hypothetical protein